MLSYIHAFFCKSTFYKNHGLKSWNISNNLRIILRSYQSTLKSYFNFLFPNLIKKYEYPKNWFRLETQYDKNQRVFTTNVAGIYLPDQDAGWETGSAFDDQLQRHGTCDADDCVCPGGKEYDVDDTDWEIVLCCCCGSQVNWFLKSP